MGGMRLRAGGLRAQWVARGSPGARMLGAHALGYRMGPFMNPRHFENNNLDQLASVWDHHACAAVLSSKTASTLR